MAKKLALVSVTRKEGLEKFRALLDREWEIISSGGTATHLRNLGIECTLIEKITGFPEMLGGRLKTMHPAIMGGILADRSVPEHMASIAEHGIRPIDLVAVNFYDFSGKPGIEQIDIGGPTLIRAAAKNGAHVSVVVHPEDYDDVINEILTQGDTLETTRESLAVKAFQYTAQYDHVICEWMRNVQFVKTGFLRSSGSH